MKIDRHERFERMIDESLAGVLSAEKEPSLREHLSTCGACGEYLSASNRVIAGLSGFSFEGTATLHARVLAALRLRAEEAGEVAARDAGAGRQHHVAFKQWAAFAVALSMACGGSALMYEMAKRVAVPMHFDTAQVQAGVVVFWLLPSFCAALCLLAAPGENRGMA